MEEQIERYNQIWQRTPLQKPDIWPSWEVVKDFVGRRCLEIGCGNYPKIPIRGGYFIDTSQAAVDNLKQGGANAFVGFAEKLSFEDNFFDLAIAFFVIEHVEDDNTVFREVHRVLKPGGVFFFSVPLGEKRFSEIDKIVGHKRRYEPVGLEKILVENNFQIIKFRCPRFSSSESIPGVKHFIKKIYTCPAHSQYFNLPRSLINLGIKALAGFGNLMKGHWQDKGFLNQIPSEGDIEILCKAVKT